MAKSEADALLSSYQDDATTTNTRAREISEEAELKLARALAQAQVKARRKAFKEVHANDFDLSVEIKEAKALEEESTAAAPTTSDEGSAQSRRPPKTVEPAGLEAPNLEGEIPQARKGEGPSLPDLAAGSRTSGSTLKGMGFDVSPPNQSSSSCSIEADETEPVDAKSTFEEAQRLCSMAFDKLKSELFHCEAKLRKALNGEKSLRLLCDKKTRELIHLRSELLHPSSETNISVSQLQRKIETLERLRGEANQINSECNDLKAQIDVHVVAKRNALAKASALEINLCNAREGDLVQTSRIAKLEIDVLKMKAEVVDARTEAEEV
ncbi:uncharacterized protein [Nicotiana sylvestris]|uniref:uncharacterized protein n=1 Tax=Nicotiana sylvestris TaxID=4096 RepID=UPI00388C7D84